MPSDTLLRRNFLSWLAAVPTVAACTTHVDNHDDPEPFPETTPDSTEEELKKCKATGKDAEGPYFQPGSPVRATKIADASEPGVPLSVEGRLYGPDCKSPLAGYAIDVWQADADGNYYGGAEDGFRLRGKIVSDGQGRYRFETILPGRYGDSEGIRPAHIHLKVLTPMGNALLTTQLYFAGDPYLGNADYCTRDGTCHSNDPLRALSLTTGVVSGQAGKLAKFDAYLART
jgi:protocatechuate 3,4-dioxygenase beta subunit